MENIVLNKDSYKEEESSGCCKLCCKVISNYCNDTICNMCNCREDKRKKICCCSNYEEKHFDKDMQCFCYCYQEKSIFYWINKFCTNEAQKKIIPCIILYFISKLCTFGCQDKYENIIQKYDKLKETKIFLLSLAVSFLFFSFVMVCGRTKKGELENEFKEDENDSAPICSYRTIFFILILITIINGFDYSYTVLFDEFGGDSVFYVFKDDKNFMEKYSLYINIIINEYFIFLLNYYCLIITKNQIDYEIIFSQSISITIYLSIVNFFLYMLKYLLKTIYKEFLFQFVITGFLLSIFILVIIFRFRECFIYYLYTKCNYSEGNCVCNICCCDKNSQCYSQCCELRCSECHCRYLCCEPFCSKYFSLFVKILCFYFNMKED